MHFFVFIPIRYSTKKRAKMDYPILTLHTM